MKQPRTVVLDACVLYPAPLRDFLMWLALSGCFLARWTRHIQDEWKRNLLHKRPDLKADQLDRTSALMDRAIPDALVEGYQGLVPGLELPDADDRHVLAAAVHCGANHILTFNQRDFPPQALAPYGVQATHPDRFVQQLFEDDATPVLEAARRQRAQLRHPQLEADRYLEILLRQGLPSTVRSLRGCLGLL